MLDKLRQLAKQAQNGVKSLDKKLKNEKQKMKDYREQYPKGSYNHFENVKEYTQDVSSVYWSKFKNLVKTEKQIYDKQMEQTFPQEKRNQYMKYVNNGYNSVKNIFTSSQPVKYNTQNNINNNNNNSNNNSNRQEQKFQQQQNQQYSQKPKEEQNFFKRKLKSFTSWALSGPLSLFQSLGFSTLKYIFIGVFVLSLGYSIPQAVSSYLQAKARMKLEYDMRLLQMNQQEQFQNMVMQLQQAQQQLLQVQQQTKKSN